jgi:hypothetical protein
VPGSAGSSSATAGAGVSSSSVRILDLAVANHLPGRATGHAEHGAAVLETRTALTITTRRAAWSSTGRTGDRGDGLLLAMFTGHDVRCRDSRRGGVPDAVAICAEHVAFCDLTFNGRHSSMVFCSD